MWKYTAKVDGMRCNMCEAHANEAVRKALAVKKVTSSHANGETVVICENEIDEEALRKAITDTGYTVGTITKEPYKKKFLGLF